MTAEEQEDMLFGKPQGRIPSEQAGQNGSALVHGPGRPSLYSCELTEEICARLEAGETLTSICSDGHMPAVRTVHDWRDRDPAFSACFTRAREIGFDVIAARTRETARGMGDSTADVQRDKLIIETDLKLLARWDPKRYGDRTETHLTGEITERKTITVNLPFAGPRQLEQAKVIEPKAEGEAEKPL